MTVLDKHAVPGQAAGYYFQVERALSWLAKVGVGATIGVETTEDVVASLGNGETIMEQDKSSTSNNIPFNIRAKDFWKTLNTWLDAVEAGEIDLSKTWLFMVASKDCGDCLARKIGAKGKKGNDLIECVSELRKEGKTCPEGIKKHVKTVLDRKDEELKALFTRIRFFDGPGVFGEELRRQVISDLQLTSNLPQDEIVDQLTGWVFSQLLQKWRAGQPGIIERDAFMLLKNNIVAKRIGKLFYEKALDIALITAEEQKGELSSTYIKQLSMIEAEDEEKIEAINDYLWCTKERTRIISEGKVTEPEFLVFENDLITRWKTLRKRIKIEASIQNYSVVIAGQKLYNETCGDYKAILAGQQTENYFLTRGTYHFLSEKLVLGWHPDYKNLILDKRLIA